MAKISKAEALEQVAVDRAAGVRRTQRTYAQSWSVSQSTANAWIRLAVGSDQEPIKSRSGADQEPIMIGDRGESTPIKTANHGEYPPIMIGDQLAVIAGKLDQIIELLHVLASPSSSALLKKTPSPLRSEGEPIADQDRRSRTDQADHDRTDHRSSRSSRSRTDQEPIKQPAQGELIDLPTPKRTDAPGPDSPLLNLLTGAIPPRLDGTRPATNAEWLDENWPLISSEAEAVLPDDATDKQFYAKAKAFMLRFWKNRKPLPKAPISRTGTGAARRIGTWEN